MPNENGAGVAVENPTEVETPSVSTSEVGAQSPSSGVELGRSRQVAEHERRGGPSPLEAQLRVQKEFREYMKQSKAELQELRNLLKSQATSAKQSEQGSFWQNPDQVVASIFDEKLKAFEERFQQSFTEQRQQAQIQQSYVAADEYLAGLGQFTDSDYAEMKMIAEERGILNHIESGVLQPQEAAEMVHYLWQKQHGINPAENTKKNGFPQAAPPKVQARGVTGQAPGAGPAKWTEAELAKIKGTPAFSKNRAAIRASLGLGG